MSEPLNVTISAVEAVKLDLSPGDTLAVTIKSDDVNRDTLDMLKEGLQNLFPDNRILIFGFGLNDEMRFNVISENKQISSCATGSYCVDCNCGKKEQYEKQN